MKEENLLHGIRKDYGTHALSWSHTYSQPSQLFDLWLKDALSEGEQEANAMTLSTLGENYIPEGRVVLLKAYSTEGFTFYTNYESKKAKQLEKHPWAAMTFHWKTQERQVRIKGKVAPVEASTSDQYHKERPRESQIAAWASPQSQEISHRKLLDDRFKKMSTMFKDQEEIPRPPFWGGYLLSPTEIEFWQGRPNRLHERLLYIKQGTKWEMKHLAP